MNNIKIVKYEAPAWCIPCRVQKKALTQALTDLNLKYEDIVEDVDIDLPHNQQRAIENKIQSIPMTLVYKNGELVDTLKGAMSVKTIKDRLLLQF